MLWTTNKSTGDKNQSIQAENQDAPSAVGGAGGGRVGGSFENLSTAAKLAKFKKSIKSKRLDLPKANFARINSGIDFLTTKAKKAFIYLQKTFTEALILRHFDPECHIWIETDALGYAISRVINQMTSDHLDQHSSDYVTHENLNPIFSKSKIG